MSPHRDHLASTSREGPSVYRWTLTLFGRVDGQSGTTLSGAEESTDYPPLLQPRQPVPRTERRRLGQGEHLRPGPVLHHETTQSECYPLTALRFTPDESALRCVGTDGIVRSLNVSPFTKPDAGTGQYYQEGAVSSDRRTVALLEGSGAELWSPLSRTKRSTVTSDPDGKHDLVNVQISSNGQRLAALRDTKVEIWDTAKEKASMLGSLPAIEPDRRDRATTEYAFSPDGTALAMQVIREIRANLGPPGGSGAVFFDPDGKSVVAAPHFGRVAFPSGEVLAKGAPSVEVDSISDDGSTLYTHARGYRPYVRLWDSRKLQPAGEDLRTGPVFPPLSNPERATRRLARRPAVRHRAREAPGYQIRVWDNRTRAQLGVALTGPVDEIVALAFTPDGSALTSVDKRGRFYTHTIAPAQLVRDLCAKSGVLTEERWRGRCLQCSNDLHCGQIPRQARIRRPNTGGLRPARPGSASAAWMTSPRFWPAPWSPSRGS